LSYIKNFIFILLFTCSTHIFANDNQIIESVIKPNIIKHFKKEKIKFLFIGKIGAHKYYAVIKYRRFQDNITLTDKGKLLSIEEDLDAMEKVEEGC